MARRLVTAVKNLISGTEFAYFYAVELHFTQGTIGTKRLTNGPRDIDLTTATLSSGTYEADGTLLSISDNADPMVKAQAEAFKDTIQQVILLYMKQAIASDRATVAGLLEKQGHKQMADIIRRI